MHVGQLTPQELGDPPLVGRVQVGEEQADGDRLGAARAHGLGQAQRLALGELGDDDAVGADPLGGLEAQLRIDQRGGLGGAEAVEVGPVLPGDLEDVGEPLGRDQGGAGAGFLEQRVGPHGHPVGECLDLGGDRGGALQHLLDRCDHSQRLVLRGGRGLRGVDPLAVDEDRVGEGPADVDSEEHGLKLAEGVAPRSGPALGARGAVRPDHDVAARRAPGRSRESRSAGGRRGTRAAPGRRWRSPRPAGRDRRSAR